jgi:signal transduction histidine kinase
VPALTLPALRPAAWVLAGATGLWLAVWLAFPLAGFWRTTALDVLWAAVALAAAATALQASRRPENVACRTPFRFLAAGAAAWGLGQAIWTGYAALLGRELPFPSLADAGYLAALPLLGAAIVTWPRQRRRWGTANLVDGAIAVSVSAILAHELVVKPMLEEGISGFAGWIALAYPVADAALAAAILCGLILDGWHERGRLLVVASGLVVLVAADTAFALAGGWNAEVFNPGWTLPFALIAVATLLPRSWGVATLSRVFPIWPLALLGAVVGLFAHEIRENASHMPVRETSEAVAIAVVLGLLVVRLWWVARERSADANAARTLALVTDPSLQRHDAAGLARELLDSVLAGSDSDGGALLVSPAAGAPLERVAATGVAAGLPDALGPDGAVTRAAVDAVEPLRLVGADARSVAPGLRSLVAVPLYDGSRLVGVLHVMSGRRRAFGGLAVSTFDALASRVARQLVLAQTHAELDRAHERERAIRNRFLAEVVGAQEREARRIADLLHDDAVQQLTALGLRLELEARRSANPGLVDLAHAANDVTASLRRLLVDLHPQVLESQGLAAAVDAAAEGLRAAGVAVDVTPLPARLAPELEALAFRLVQEALTNLHRHGRASRATVDLRLAGGMLRCRVADDGAGFDPASLSNAGADGRFGLELVRDRVELAGGRFLLESAPGTGTTFGFELPAHATAVDERIAETGAS